MDGASGVTTHGEKRTAARTALDEAVTHTLEKTGAPIETGTESREGVDIRRPRDRPAVMP